MRIELIGFTNIDWTKYMSFCKEKLGEAPTRNLDASKLRFNEQLTFALTLNEIAGRTSEPFKTIRDGNLNLDAISIVFIASEIEFEWYGSIKKVDLLNQISLLSGTLREWKDTIVSNLSLDSDNEKHRRIFFMLVLSIFEEHDFKAVWGNYSRVNLEDGTVCLKEK